MYFGFPLVILFFKKKLDLVKFKYYFVSRSVMKVISHVRASQWMLIIVACVAVVGMGVLVSSGGVDITGEAFAIQQAGSTFEAQKDVGAVPTLTSDTAEVGDAKQVCTDSDGGQDYYVKGTRKSWRGNVQYTEEDECRNAVTLVEYYCTGALYPECDYGCLDGRCLKQCEDSDAGLEHQEFSAGLVHGTTPDGVEVERSDHCASPHAVYEGSCVEGYVTSNTLQCPGLCKQGRCLRADLRVAGADYAVEKDKGELIMTFTVNNEGAMYVTDPFTVSIAVSGYGPILTLGAYRGSIEAGKSAKVELRVDMSNTNLVNDIVSKGSTTISSVYVVMDYDDDIPEEDEENNDYLEKDIVLTQDDFVFSS